ncbi:MAG: N-acetylglucosamine-6-phosphate deacetylase, partial [Treponema sp.]|nr:N-acetylglucosamine-6-phosphate deacetylase [Treponema sp.]
MTGFASMEQCAVLVEDGQVADVFSKKRFEQKRFPPGTRIIDVNGAFIAPGFIDTHIHGFGGHGTDDASTEA